MALLRSLIMAFSCFSRIPMPEVEWSDESLRYMLCFFPFVGVCVAFVWWLWSLLCAYLGFGSSLFGAGMTVAPLLVTGGIHMDGFADVVDAQSSHAERAKKREILKDPHVGAFAIIGVVAYILLYFALFSELEPANACFPLLAVPFYVRCLSGLATTAFPKSAKVGMVSSFQESSNKRAVLAVLFVFTLVCAVVFAAAWQAFGIILFVLGLVCLALFYVFEKTQFGGMSGDLSGFFLQSTELVLVFGIVIISKVVGLS